MPRRSLSAFAFIVAAGVSMSAQTPSGPVVTAQLLNVTRAERWSFFEPPPEGGDPDYTLASNRARFGLQVDLPRVSFEGAFQYAQLVGLPRTAFGPGPLGPGALFFAAARTPEAYQLYFKSLSLQLKDVVPHLTLRIGRMSYESGERTPFSGRLIGNAEWTPFERAFDGVRLDYERAAWRGHFSFFMPTQGAFEESANPTIGEVQLTTATWGAKGVELFAHNYRDRRAVQARPDNTGITADGVDINLQTFGASADVKGLHLWGAIQRGGWFGQPHRAFSVSGDVGHQWSGSPARPSIRGGMLYASGDADPNDARHETFFVMVPTTRPDLLRGTFAAMNLRDIYATVSLHPHQHVRIAGEIHHLSLAHRLDRWYTGTGATAFRGDYFGFSSRGSTLRTGLGTFVQLSGTTQLKKQWSVTAAAAAVRGGDVVQRQFAGSTLFVMAIESVLSFR